MLIVCNVFDKLQLTRGRHTVVIAKNGFEMTHSLLQLKNKSLTDSQSLLPEPLLLFLDTHG